LRVRLIAILVALVAVAAGAVPVGAASNNQFSTPHHYYLSLGDSLAFGFQQAKFNQLFPNEDPAAFNTGYANDFAASLQLVNGGIRLVNYGCPGETTGSFINGGCPYPFALHNAFTKNSQLDTAVAFLDAHPGQVSPITIDIGSNDVTHALVPICLDPTQAQACAAAVQTLLPVMAGNLSTIIATLHAASPRSEIIVLDLYNPLAVVAPASDQIAAEIDNTIQTVASSQGARLADVFGTFNPGGPAEVATLCVLTAICTPLQDTHPTDTGYAAMALKLWQASGYSLSDD
jgi:lysophospholipase L1-like esterase